MSLAFRFGCFGGIAAVRVESRLGSRGVPPHTGGLTALRKRGLWMLCFVGMNIFTCLDGGRRQSA